MAWAHGSTGCFGNCAPSHIRTLSAQFFAPYTMALQGYVVVAPDYAGLGVNIGANGETIANEFASNPSHANDLFYAVQAAQSAFVELSKEFVVVGHSEGGGSAWGAAQRQATEPVDGYLGAVAAAPNTKAIEIAKAQGIFGGLGAVLAARGAASIFPTTSPSDFLTPAGVARLDLFSALQGCNAVLIELFLDGDLFQPNWADSFYARAYQNLTSTGGQRIAGPLLVLQGTADTNVPANITTQAVDDTCTLFPKSHLEYVLFPNVTHDIMWPAQRTWLQWVEDRFAGVPVAEGCQRETVASARDSKYYQATQNWFLEYSTAPYENA